MYYTPTTLNYRRGRGVDLVVRTLVDCLLFTVVTHSHGAEAATAIPRFTIDPQSSLPRLASPVTLSCSAQPDTVTIQWRLNGTPFLAQSTSAKQPRTYDVGGSRLRIEAFSPADEGVYQCLASNALGAIVSAEARLEAAALGTFERARTVTDLVALEGSVAVVPCPPPPSRPAAVIEFELNGTLITPSSRYVILPSGNLQIADVRQSDRGVYQCTAFNSVTGARVRSPATHQLSVIGSGPTSRPARVILAPPESVTFAQDADVTLECAAEGFPPPRVTWEKYGGHLPVGRFTQILGNLVIRGAQRFDAGTYLCRASNGVNNATQERIVSVDIIEMPVIEAPPVDQSATEGGTVLFKCRSQAAARVTIEWKFNGNTLVNGQFVSVRDTTLTLSNVQLRQAGVYQCIAKNHIGMTHAAVRLQVHGVQRPAARSGVNSSKSQSTLIKDFNDRAEEEDEGDDESEYGLNEADQFVSKAGRPTKAEDLAPLAAPSRPEVHKLSETSVLVRWSYTSSPLGGGPTVTAYRVQYKDLQDRTSDWRTMEEDIPAARRQHEVLALKSGTAYRFRVAAIYSNHDSRISRNSAKITLGAVQQTKSTTPGPIIVEARPLSINEIFIGWQQHDTDGWPVDGFNIYYAPFHEAVRLQKQTVEGSNVRHAVLSHLTPATSYSIRVQSYSALGGESGLSNTVVKQTLTYINEPPPDSDIDPSHDQFLFAPRKSAPDPARSRSAPFPFPVYNDEEERLQKEKRPNVASKFLSSVDEGNSKKGDGGGGGEGSEPGEGQMMYVVLGAGLGAVAMVAMIFVVVCVLKRRIQRRRATAAGKECKNLQTSDQSETFLDTSTLKPEYLGQGHTSGMLHGSPASGVLKQNYVSGFRACTSFQKGPPELHLPPPPLFLPPQDLTLRPNCSAYCSSQDNGHSAIIAPSPIYAKLPDRDDSRSSGASERRLLSIPGFPQHGISINGNAMQGIPVCEFPLHGVMVHEAPEQSSQGQPVHQCQDQQLSEAYDTLEGPPSSINISTLGGNSLYPESCASFDTPEPYEETLQKYCRTPSDGIQPVGRPRQFAINPADYQCGQNVRAAGNVGWKILANRVSDGTYNPSEQDQSQAAPRTCNYYPPSAQ